MLPSTETWRLLTCAMDTVTSGFTTNLPSRSFCAIFEPACEGVSPASGTSPSIGKRIVPRSETRASVVRSGLRKTVMRTMSPMPSASSCVAGCSSAGWAAGMPCAGGVNAATFGEGEVTLTLATGWDNAGNASATAAERRMRGVRFMSVSCFFGVSGPAAPGRRRTLTDFSGRLLLGLPADDPADKGEAHEQHCPLRRLRHRRHRPETGGRALHGFLADRRGTRTVSTKGEGAALTALGHVAAGGLLRRGLRVRGEGGGNQDRSGQKSDGAEHEQCLLGWKQG